MFNFLSFNSKRELLTIDMDMKVLSNQLGLMVVISVDSHSAMQMISSRISSLILDSIKMMIHFSRISLGEIKEVANNHNQAEITTTSMDLVVLEDLEASVDLEDKLITTICLQDLVDNRMMRLQGLVDNRMICLEDLEEQTTVCLVD